MGDYILYSLGVRFKEAKSEKNEKATTSRFLILSRDDHVKKNDDWVGFDTAQVRHRGNSGYVNSLLLKMAIEFVDCPITKMVDLSIV